MNLAAVSLLQLREGVDKMQLRRGMEGVDEPEDDGQVIPKHVVLHGRGIIGVEGEGLEAELPHRAGLGVGADEGVDLAVGREPGAGGGELGEDVPA